MITFQSSIVPVVFTSRLLEPGVAAEEEDTRRSSEPANTSTQYTGREGGGSDARTLWRAVPCHNTSTHTCSGQQRSWRLVISGLFLTLLTSSPSFIPLKCFLGLFSIFYFSIYCQYMPLCHYYHLIFALFANVFANLAAQYYYSRSAPASASRLMQHHQWQAVTSLASKYYDHHNSQQLDTRYLWHCLVIAPSL